MLQSENITHFIDRDELHVRMLRRMVFFRDLSDSSIRLLAPLAQIQKYPAQRQLATEGEYADLFLVILKGSILVSIYQNGHHIPVQKLGAEEVFGWSWIFPPHVWDFDARTLVETEVLAFNGTKLRKLCDSEPRLGYELMKKLSYVFTLRLKQTRLQLYRQKEFRPRWVEL